MNRITLSVLLTCLFTCAGFTVQDEEQIRFTPDKYLFKGRLVGISFPYNEQSEIEISLHFTMDDSYAILLPSSREKVVAVRTHWPARLDDINRDNYVKGIEALLPANLHLGEQYLVIANHPGALGWEIVSFEHATPANEKRFIETHRDYMRQYQQYFNNAILNANVMKMKSLKDMVRRQRVAYKEEGVIDQGREDYINHLQQQLVQQREACITTFEELLLSLQNRRAKASDEFERQTIDQMIQDTQRELELAEAFDLSTEE